MITQKRKWSILNTELDILVGALIDFELGKKDIKEVIKCVLVFRRELEKLK